MSEIFEDKNLSALLQLYLENFERIFLVIDRKKSNLLMDFCNSKALKDCKYKILILSSENTLDSCAVKHKKIAEKDCNTLYRLYHMYEFSDKFRVLSEEKKYGEIFNFNDTGILDIEEIFEAVLN